MARLRRRTSYNKCDNFISTLGKLDIVSSIRPTNVNHILIVPIECTSIYYNWVNKVHKANIKRYKNAVK